MKMKKIVENINERIEFYESELGSVEQIFSKEELEEDILLNYLLDYTENEVIYVIKSTKGFLVVEIYEREAKEGEEDYYIVFFESPNELDLWDMLMLNGGDILIVDAEEGFEPTIRKRI